MKTKKYFLSILSGILIFTINHISTKAYNLNYTSFTISNENNNTKNFSSETNFKNSVNSTSPVKYK